MPCGSYQEGELVIRIPRIFILEVPQVLWLFTYNGKKSNINIKYSVKWFPNILYSLLCVLSISFHSVLAQSWLLRVKSTVCNQPLPFIETVKYIIQCVYFFMRIPSALCGKALEGINPTNNKPFGGRVFPFSLFLFQNVFKQQETHLIICSNNAARHLSLSPLHRTTRPRVCACLLRWEASSLSWALVPH